jgi:hypothetical protein
MSDHHSRCQKALAWDIPNVPCTCPRGWPRKAVAPRTPEPTPAREIEKQQAVIDKMADAVSASNQRNRELEAEAQALRAGLTEALEHYGNLAYSELKPSPYYDREEAKITRLSALLSPAQEAP